MATHIALLRGINVGGRNKVAMADLRELMTSLGHTEVVTYIQSGNAVFSTGETDTAALADAMEQAIAATLGVKPAVVVLSRDELAQVARDNPYSGEPVPKLVHVVFFRDPPGPGTEEALREAERWAAERGGRDAATLLGRAVYLHTPDGFGRSEMVKRLQARRASPATTGTARNWATVTKLLAMCDA